MSVQPVNLLLGTGELFFKRDTDASGKYVHVGSLKGQVQFSYTMDTAEQKPGNKLTVARRDKIAERASLTAEVCDFKVSQLIAALGLSISTTQLTQTLTMRYFEDITFGSTTTTKTLANTAVSTTSVVVYSMDRSTKRVKGTDFTVLSTTKIKPITAGNANRSQFIAYDTRDVSASRVKVGDKTKLQVVDLKFSHKQQNGKIITIEIPLATVMGGLTVPFNETGYTTYNIRFDALGDTTATAGESLFKIIREA